MIEGSNFGTIRDLYCGCNYQAVQISLSEETTNRRGVCCFFPDLILEDICV